MDTVVFASKMDEVLFQESKYALVVKEIAPFYPGQVQFQGTYWTAKFRELNSAFSAPMGSHVKIIGREGITLLAEPLIS